MKLTSGKEVELRKISWKERKAAKNAAKVVYNNDDSIMILESANAEELWIRAGLDKIDGKKFYGLDEDKQDEALMKLSDPDLVEISVAVQNQNTLGDVEAKK